MRRSSKIYHGVLAGRSQRGCEATRKEPARRMERFVFAKKENKIEREGVAYRLVTTLSNMADCVTCRAIKWF